VPTNAIVQSTDAEVADIEAPKANNPQSDQGTTAAQPQPRKAAAKRKAPVGDPSGEDEPAHKSVARRVTRSSVVTEKAPPSSGSGASGAGTGHPFTLRRCAR
jgi:hypothetical protein